MDTPYTYSSICLDKTLIFGCDPADLLACFLFIQNNPRFYFFVSKWNQSIGSFIFDCPSSSPDTLRSNLNQKRNSSSIIKMRASDSNWKLRFGSLNFTIINGCENSPLNDIRYIYLNSFLTGNGYIRTRFHCKNNVICYSIVKTTSFKETLQARYDFEQNRTEQ